MIWSVPRLISPRGAGLGNEIIPWAKAYLGARALNLRPVEPPWRVNPRRYDRELGKGIFGSVGYFALRALPAVDITTEMVIATGKTDYFEAMVSLAPELRTKTVPSILHSSGMHGGYLGIRRSRHYLRRELLGASGALASLEEMESWADPCVRIGVHIRGGDFDKQEQVKPNSFNVQLPLAWYVEVVQSLSRALGVPAQVFLATDSPSAVVADALTIEGRRPVAIASDSVGDLAMMTNCDILVSSVSSFSMLAAFLSEAPYVWNRDQLGESNGWLSIWGHEPEGHGGGVTSRSVADQSIVQPRVRRGISQGSKPLWRAELLNQLEFRARSRHATDDLIFYGVTERPGK
jgi:hypothetical protein